MKLRKKLSLPIGSAVHCMKGSEAHYTKCVSPVASISLLIGSDVHHFFFTCHLIHYPDQPSDSNHRLSEVHQRARKNNHAIDKFRI